MRGSLSGCVILTSEYSTGVLLDQVARPIRRYLREREDTVPIVVGGLLADPEDDASTSEVLIELAQEMSKSASLVGKEDNETELDYDDMDWMPDPVDAGPEYKKSKYSDVIGSLISLFESKHVRILVSLLLYLEL